MATAKIGRELGVSKGACTGKASRLHLERRPSPIRALGSGKAKPKKARVTPLVRKLGAMPVIAPAMQPTFTAPEPYPAWMSLPTRPCPTCQYPMWKTGQHATYPALFCGMPSANAKVSWCGEHMRIVCEGGTPNGTANWIPR